MWNKPIFTVEDLYTFKKIDECVDVMNELTGYKVRYEVNSRRNIDVYSHPGMIDRLRERGYVCKKY